MKLKHTFLVACLSVAPLGAQQVESKTEVQKSESSSGDGNANASGSATASSNGQTSTQSSNSSTQGGGNNNNSNRRPHRTPPGAPPNPPNKADPQAQNQKPVPYIGVMTREVSPELRAQFALPEGFGLMVEEVMPDSPAEHAGIKVHDILVKFEDQRLVSMEQLMLLVRSKHQGDSVNLTVITGGKEAQVPVVLGEHVMPAMQPRMSHNFAGWPQGGMPFNGNGFGGDFRGFQNQNRELNEQMERFQKEMREYQQRIQDWARQGSNGIMPQPPMFNLPGAGGGNNPPPRGGGRANGVQMQPGNPGNGNVQQFNFTESHAATNVTRRDDSGEYTIKREDGKTTFIARPNNGAEQSWPINTDAERGAVPQAFRDKLRMMDGADSNIRIQINPGPGGAAPQPAPAPNSTNPPAPKDRSTSA